MLKWSRVPFILLAAAALVVGLWTGLSRLGWDLDLTQAGMHHGAIMVGGFLGTLITLEKIVPLKKNWLFLVPLTSGASVVSFLFGRPDVSFILLMLASAGLSAVFLCYLAKQKNIIYLVMAAGSLCWLTGNLLLLSATFYPMAFPWWLGFALLVITAERLELMKFLPVPRLMKGLLMALLAAYVCGVLLSFHSEGSLISGVALIGVSLWLMRYDIIAISMRKTALPKFVAIALTAGYVALLFTGVFFIALQQQAMAYDAVVHGFFLGFVFSMIFAHGPIILPGVLGLAAKPFHPTLYLWLGLLHLSWIVRVTGDIALDFQLRKMSGVITVVAIISYFATLATLTIIARQRNAKIL